MADLHANVALLVLLTLLLVSGARSVAIAPVLRRLRLQPQPA